MAHKRKHKSNDENSDGSSDDSDRSHKHKRRHHRSSSREDSTGASRKHKKSRSPNKEKKKKKTAWDDTTSAYPSVPGISLTPSQLAGISTQIAAAGSSGSVEGTSAALTLAAQLSMARLYVGNIYFEIEEEEIRTLFERCGAIKAIQMTRDPGPNGKHKGFCFVEFESFESAEIALSTMNNFQLAGRPLRVGRPHNPAASISASSQQQQQMILMNQQMMMQQQPLIANMSEDKIAKEHGLPSLKSVKFCVPGEPKTPSGYPLKGDPKVYVSNLPLDSTQESLQTAFPTLGVLKSFKIDRNPCDESTQFTIFELADEQTAEQAVKRMHGHKINGFRIKVGRVLPSPAAQNTTIFQQHAPSQSLNQQYRLVASSILPFSSSVSSSSSAQNFHSDDSGNTNNSILHEESLHLTSGSARLALMHKLLRKDEAETWKIAHSSDEPLPKMHQHNQHAKAVSVIQRGEVDTPTRCVVLTNLVASTGDVDDDLGVEVKEECSKYGQVEHLLIFDEENPTTNQTVVKFFILYVHLHGAVNAVAKLNGRFFAKRKISCQFYSEAAFRKLLSY